MIETLTTVLPLVIYFLLIIFLIVVIVLGIKLIITVDMINNLILDIQRKIASLDNIFRLVSNTTDKLGSIGSKVIDGAMGIINKLIGNKKRKDEDDYA